MLFYLNNHRGGFFRFFNGGNSFGDDSNYLQQQQLQLQQQQQQQQISGADQGLNLLALQALADTLNQGSGFNLGNLFSSPSNQRPTVQQNYGGLQADQSQGGGGFFGMLKPVTDVVSNLLTGVVGNRFSRRLNKRSLPDEGRHRIEKRIVNLKDAPPVQQNFFEGLSSDAQLNTLYSLEEPLRFSNDNRLKSGTDESSLLALRFPVDVNKQEIPLSQLNQGNFISPSDVARRLKQLFPEASGQLRFDNDQFNRELLRALVNDRIAKILSGAQQVQQPRPITSSNYNTNRYQSNQQKYPTQSNYYAGGGSSNYNSNDNINANRYNKGDRDRSHIVYITGARGQIEYTLNELTGEKQRY